MKKLLPLSLLCFLLSSIPSFAQEGDQWFVSADIGVSFKCAPPEVYSLFPNLPNGKYSTYEDRDSGYSRSYCTSISDTNGNLLFYASNLSLYNRNRQFMPHGHDSVQRYLQQMSGNGIIPNSILTVPDPGNINRYYVFFIDFYADPAKSWGIYDVCYALVDMRMDNGLGDVVEEKRHLLKQDFRFLVLNVPTDNYGLTCTYSLNAVRNKNKHDFLVTTLEAYGIPGGSLDSLVVFSVTDAGVSWHKLLLDYFTSSYPGICFSPNGKKIAIYEMVNKANPIFYLYDFDDSSGHISNPLRIKGIKDMTALAFSPDNTKMYAYTSDGYLYQYDLSKGSDTAVINSSRMVVDSDTLPMGYSFNWKDLQLAPDGKIYGINSDGETLSVTGASFLRAIEKPNEPAALCMPNDYAVKINLPLPTGLKVGAYAPGYPPHFVTRKQEFMPYDISGFCSNTPIFFTPFQNFYSTTYHWDFGDPTSGTANTSTQRMGVHLYKNPGTYKVHFAAWNYDSIPDTFTRFVCISAGLVPVKMDTVLCSGETVTLDAGNPGAKYLWNDGDTLQTKTTGPGTYWVSVANGSCTITDSAHIIGIISAKINLGNDTTIANGTTLILHSGYPTTVWSTGTKGDTIHVTKAGTYWAALIGDQCEVSDTIVVSTNSGIAAPTPNGSFGLKLHPNPSSDKIFLEFVSEQAGNYKISVTDLTGKTVYTHNFEAVPGTNQFTINVQGLPSGTYIAEVRNGSGVQQIKFEKKGD